MATRMHLHRNRRLFDGLGDESVDVAFAVLKDFSRPMRASSTPAVHSDDHQIPAELFNPRRTIDEALQLARGIYIANKNSAGIEMAGNASKGFLPVRKSPQVIDRVEGADDGVEPPVDVKTRHVPPEKTDMRQFRARDREHGPGAIEAGDIVGFRQAAQ